MSVLIFVGLAIAAYGLYRLNTSYYRDLKRMTPEEREKFKEDERCDLQTW